MKMTLQIANPASRPLLTVLSLHSLSFYSIFIILHCIFTYRDVPLSRSLRKMPGFEVVGIVLGAFPLALHLLDDYREMAKRAGLWYRIRLEYTKCRNDVQFQRVAFSSHLRQLVLPLLVDDIKAGQLLSDPGGTSWQEPSIDSLLRDRLGQTYDLYLSYITGMEEVMTELNKELSTDSTPIQDKLTKGVSIL